MELEEIAEGLLDEAECQAGACAAPEDPRDPEPPWVDAYEW